MKDIRKSKEQQIRELQTALHLSNAENEKLKADIDYISMMSEIEIPEADDEQI